LLQVVTTTPTVTLTLPAGGGWVGWFTRSPKVALTDVIVYPNPYEPAKGHTGITFDGLPAQVVLHLYTASARIVKVYEGPTDGHWVWDGRNTQGQKVAPGVYLFVMEADGKRVSGKFAIIR
jgi:flagellar hook assembly protein FlgD